MASEKLQVRLVTDLGFGARTKEKGISTPNPWNAQ